MLDRTKAPEIRPFGRLSIPDEHTETLSNGLVLHTLFGGDQDVARLNIIADGGTYDCARQCTASFAAELLREGRHNISEIADMTGFSTLSHFSTSFKKQFGVSPTDYLAEG